MELREFVKLTLVHVVRGVVEAQEAVAEDGAQIVPRAGNTYGATEKLMHTDEGVVETVSFDVAVTASSNEEMKGGIGIFVVPFGFGARGESKRHDTTISRI
ncbi:hypothetical protein LCGC14_1696380, partial [marine sediment metagenome]